MATLVRKAVFALGIDKGISYVSIGHSFSVIFGGVLYFILAAEMPANYYGTLNYYLSITTIFSSLALLGFDNALTTFLAKGMTRMLSESVFLTSSAALIVSIILAVAFESLPVILMFLGLMFYVLSLAELLGKRLYKEYMSVLIIQRALSLFLAPVMFVHYGLDGAIYGLSISYLALCYRFFVSLRTITFSISTLRPIKNFIFHSYAYGISRSLVWWSDKLIIAPLFGVTILGYYQLGIQMLIASSVIPVIFNNYLLPQQAANKNENIKKLEGLGMLLSILMTVSLIYLAPSIIYYLFPKFKVAQTATQIVLLAGIPLSMVGILSAHLMAREKSFHVLLASGIFLGVEYVSIVVLGQKYGLIGLSLSPVLAALYPSSLLACHEKKDLKISITLGHQN